MDSFFKQKCSSIRFLIASANEVKYHKWGLGDSLRSSKVYHIGHNRLDNAKQKRKVRPT